MNKLSTTHVRMPVRKLQTWSAWRNVRLGGRGGACSQLPTRTPCVYRVIVPVRWGEGGDVEPPDLLLDGVKIFFWTLRPTSRSTSMHSVLEWANHALSKRSRVDHWSAVAFFVFVSSSSSKISSTSGKSVGSKFPHTLAAKVQYRI